MLNQTEAQAYKIMNNEQVQGIYRLYDTTQEIIYIGQSIDIATRLKQHLRDKNNIFYFDFAEVKNENKLNAYEKYQINKYQPIKNKSHKNQLISLDGSQYPRLSFSSLRTITEFIEKSNRKIYNNVYKKGISHDPEKVYIKYSAFKNNFY
ncbi:GIY-YIG nuclease family protein [Halanaerobaculum tunisiense]